ncbi:MAG: trehalase family glycosidase [Planctomycetota bacterium]|nr:trehalase family glycosidase [Planctomycetota bacterium]MDW8372421.1 trehalase family glycosidase [Planctomycetota bacterium]
MLECPVELAPLSGEAGESAGAINVPRAGTVVIAIDSTRPLACWLDEWPVLDEPLWWRRYERRLRALLVLPLSAGRHPLRVRYGPRPLWPERLDRDCPSRQRAALRAALLARPDRIALTAEVQPAAPALAAALRITPAQCWLDGVLWQQVWLRPLPWPTPDPSIDDDHPCRRPLPCLRLRSALPPHAARDISDDDDRRAGIQRLLLPVADAAQPLPAARAEDACEERLEPELVVVRTLAATLELGWSRLPETAAPPPAPSEPVRLSVPVHEARGRWAPVREPRTLSWPASAEELLARVPRPVAPPQQAHLLAVHDHAWRMLLGLRRAPAAGSGLPNDYLATSHEGFGEALFVWDSCFTALCTAWGWRALPAAATLDCLYSRQMDGGYLPRETDTRDGLPVAYEPDFSPNPPLLAWAEWQLARLSGDSGRWARVLPALVALHRWLARHRRLPDGTYWTTGLASGLDNSPAVGDGYPCLTAQQAQAAGIIAEMWQALGREAEAALWRAEHAAIAAAMNRCLWSEQAQFYCVSQLSAGGHSPHKTVTGFWPLLTGAVPPERVAALERWLCDPAAFWRHHPVPSLAADSPDYDPQGGYWRGGTWAPTTAAVAWGFARAGRFALARRIALRHLAVVAEVYRATGALWETWAPDSSQPGTWARRDYSWSALPATALLYELVIGIEPDAVQRRLVWHHPQPGWGLQRIPLGEATIDLLCYGPGHYAVVCDQAFTCVIDDGRIRHERCFPPGRWEWRSDSACH